MASFGLSRHPSNFRPSESNHTLVELLLLFAVGLTSAYFALVLLRDAQPEPFESRINGYSMISLRLSGLDVSSAMTVRFGEYSTSSDRSPDALLGDQISIEIHYNGPPTVPLLGTLALYEDLMIIPEKIETSSPIPYEEFIVEDYPTFQEFKLPPNALDDRNQVHISGRMRKHLVSRYGAVYRAFIPSCNAHVNDRPSEPGDGGCRVDFGALPTGLRIDSMTSDSILPDMMAWELPRGGTATFTDYRRSDQLDRYVFYAGGLLGIAGAALFEAVLRLRLVFVKRHRQSQDKDIARQPISKRLGTRKGKDNRWR